ncbi:MlaD family protein [Nocardia crassostreae]|uniref:MlaD family protein n=1 Tax=Nocardia crassostreae TaxID=53428 RepID=UPI000833C6A2|nr:MlaD family protein [Nocardia crassostreae]
MKRGHLVSLATIGVILVLGSVYLAFGVVHVNWFRPELNATMTLPDSGGLIPRSKVLLSGVQVGEVTAVATTYDAVRVDFRVNTDYRIPLNSTARIENMSGLGETYIEFRPTALGGPYLADGQTVSADRVTAPLSIPDMARQTTDVLRQLDPQALSEIVRTFDEAMAGTQAVIPELSRATDLLAATLLSRTDVIDRMLRAMQARADDMAWAGPALTDAAGPWADFGPRVSDVAAAIARVVRSGDVPADYLIDTPESMGIIPLLRELTDRVNRLGPELAPLIPVLRPVVGAATGVAHGIDLGALITQALNSTTDDGALHLRVSLN